MGVDSSDMLNMQAKLLLFTNYNVHCAIKSAIKPWQIKSRIHASKNG